MARKRRIVLHIGPHKTATTLIQGALAAAEDDLRSEGLHYSRVGRRGHAQHKLAWTLYRGDRQVGLHTQGTMLPLWQEVREELTDLITLLDRATGGSSDEGND